MNSENEKEVSGRRGNSSVHWQRQIRAGWIRRGCSVEFKDYGIQSLWDETQRDMVDVPIFRIRKIWNRKTNKAVYFDAEC